MGPNCESFGCRGTKNKIGILIAQLGTPDAPTPGALRRYLKQFLSDPRVIEVNRAVWWLLLNGLILRTRPKRSARLYGRIWREDGSPLRIYTQRQTDGVRERLLNKLPTRTEVVFGMRYGSPSLESAVDGLVEKGCSRILLFPMYPQYSATTTAATYDVVMSHLLKRRFVPTLRVAEPYFAHPAYVGALAATMNESVQSLSWKPDRIVLSYHGIPAKYVAKGDPYCCQCTETTAALLPKLEFPADRVIHTFQSRFGKDPWLQPYTDVTFEELGKTGVTSIAVAAPGFTADCLETLDELGNEGHEQFHGAGGRQYHLIPCLNDSPIWLDAMASIIEEELGSWITPWSSNGCEIECPMRGIKVA
jgi:protoporphyrin/coproporphyrin ferrochelatase